MFIENRPKEQKDYYGHLLKSVGALSKLFSEAPQPYLAPRATENIFCKAFEAENLSRSDISVDAAKDGIGIGIKTFLEGNGRTLQKIAEFNADHMLFNNLNLEEKVQKITELRNERIEITKRIYKLDSMVYHCITRDVGKIFIYECPMLLIQQDKIKDISELNRTIKFSDSIEEYSFNVSKSTLYRRFITRDVLLDLPVRMLEDPFTEVGRLMSEAGPIFSSIKPQPHVFLPLYSIRREKHVPERSGLNQWNASGRQRDLGEVYIPIPAWIHEKFPNFFPERDIPFELMLPDRNILNAKVCQDNSKALMSNPNLALGKWLLRDVLRLKEGELLTYEKLEEIGLDSVVIYKIDGGHYDIDFAKIGSYEEFYFENMDRE